MRRILGALVLFAPPLGLAVGASVPSVRGNALRVADALTGDLFPSGARDRRFAVGALERIALGAPVFLEEPDGTWRPVAHVVGADAGGTTLRFEPGEEVGASWVLRVLPSPGSLGEAIELAVSRSAQEDLGRDLVARLQAVLEEAILPEAQRRLPAFWAQVGPGTDERSRQVLEAVGREVLERLKPVGESLASTVSGALDAELGTWDRARLGAGWIFKGSGWAKDRLMPIVDASARQWLAAHQGEVFDAIVKGVSARSSELKQWLGGEVLEAARRELVIPVFEATRPRLEKEAQAWFARATREVALAPDGRFRIRFAAVLRRHLLDKEGPLLLIERGR